jgi:alcohol dehydrogenase class IV
MKNLPDEEAAARFCSIMEDFLKEIGMSFCFEDLKVPKEELRALAEASLILPDYQNHPRVANLDEIHELLLKSCRI